MRYLFTFTSLVLIGALGFQFATVSAVATTSTVSGEKRVIKQPVTSQKAQLLKLKRTLNELKKKLLVLENQMATLKKQIELKSKSGLVTSLLEKRLLVLVKQYNQTKESITTLQKKIENMGSGALNQ